MPRHRVLIVDDDPGAIEAFEPMLRTHGYDVRVAADAESGFREVERLHPAAMLLDLHLPVVDGLEFLRRIRSAGHTQLPTAFITADYLLDDDVTDEIHRLGARLYFKPLWEEDLTAIVAILLESQPVYRPTT